MKNPVKHFVTVGNTKYFYTIKPGKKGVTSVKCEAANIAQEFLNEDIPELLNDLPKLILAEKDYKKSQNEVIRFRVSSEDKEKIEKKAVKKGYSSVSGFLRDLALKGA